ncbi:related to calcium-independent phospholipase A2 [Lecanosticta acicola]|uniref:Related to calcium-independent phospholipase A2 n=1 Tax=Lecanosticta acicola TaxID=111012 RepID=A0AAI8YZT3_9PEZI|nr:related to calcium-independent phospholipase A2 [Lecanosticta acicola]
MEESRPMRRKDTTKGPPLRILSLDGGGIRGYSMLIILQELMHRTFVETEGRAPKRHEIPKPCDHFDLIAGTGTGGLIAIMLGRLRLDLDTCKEVYVRMTRRVFETDKTFLGMPYKGTMFKASKLEEVIREVAREHTVFDDEGNDALANATPMTPATPTSASTGAPQRSMSQSSRYSGSSRYSQMSVGPMSGSRGMGSLHLGNPNALLYDTRENRTKTAVTAVLKGTSVITLLRSYDSRKEPAPDVNCTIWQAGRATSATQMAFKPIQIGQSLYLDEGAGKYNPSPQILDEAVQNEWPGREVGIFVSIGTGKRPPGTGARQHEWWEDFLGGSMGDFAEARRRLIMKLEGCEESHRYMVREHLAARGVSPENYFRLNVEIGVGEFGMNEWHRLSEISTNTRSYLSKNDVQALSLGAAAKLAKIHITRTRHERAEARRAAGHDGLGFGNGQWQQQQQQQQQHNPWERPLPTSPAPTQFAVELPGDDTFRPGQHFDNHRSSAGESYPMGPDSYYIHRADQKFRQQQQHHHSPSANSVRPPSEHQSLRFSSDAYQVGPGSPRHSQESAFPSSPPPPPPPVPPKTPVNAAANGLPYPDSPQTPPPAAAAAAAAAGGGAPRTFMNMGELGRKLPYPDVQGPPPPVNMDNKPTMTQ